MGKASRRPGAAAKKERNQQQQQQHASSSQHAPSSSSSGPAKKRRRGQRTQSTNTNHRSAATTGENGSTESPDVPAMSTTPTRRFISGVLGILVQCLTIWLLCVMFFRVSTWAEIKYARDPFKTAAGHDAGASGSASRSSSAGDTTTGGAPAADGRVEPTKTTTTTEGAWWPPWRATDIITSPLDGQTYTVPRKLTQSFGSYPDPWNITDEMRQQFHPVVIFPDDVTYKVVDLSGSTSSSKEALANNRPLSLAEAIAYSHSHPNQLSQRPAFESQWSIGGYDEDRRGMYPDDFTDDGGDELRTIHVGMDIGGPVGTEVHAFTDGVVVGAGYNEGIGDYGYVIVLEHTLPSSSNNKMWALYGHLDKKSVKGMRRGKKIRTGQVIGRFGDVHENGGWKHTHVHFQLSTIPPPTSSPYHPHDMPGVATASDRYQALILYPDPRIVLGPLY